MKKIDSFTVNHNCLVPGIYISRKDGDLTTYDLRTRKPNCGIYMDNQTMHSLEHMFATYIRNSTLSDDVIYFGPMGCQTGFYLIIRNANNLRVLSVVKEVLKKILEHEGDVFGSTSIECGNYRNLELASAKAESKLFLSLLESNPNVTFQYPNE
jgi:LuxS protein involved in autoinducer AI2 synthesis